MAEEDKTGIHCRAIVEVLGKPKEHVEDMLRKYVAKIKEDDKIKLTKEYFAQAKETDDIQEGVMYYTAFAEIEFLTSSIPKLIGFCFDYMPSSVEIIKPDSLVLRNTDFANMLNDLQARSHDLDSAVKQLRSQNEFLRRNIKNLLKNSILISLSINNLTLQKLAKITGLNEKEMAPFLEELLNEGKIEKTGEEYKLKRG